mgnify:CR=1 FL=1
MARPAKTAAMIEFEGKSHRTKEELETRKKAEEELASGVKLKEFSEVKNNTVAHKEFSRLQKLFKIIKINDDLHAGPINRYCMLKSECNAFEGHQERIIKQCKKLDSYDANKDLIEIINIQAALSKQLLYIDKQLQSKRKMLLDIEKENLMTMAAALRSITKKPQTGGHDNNRELFD